MHNKLPFSLSPFSTFSLSLWKAPIFQLNHSSSPLSNFREKIYKNGESVNYENRFFYKYMPSLTFEAEGKINLLLKITLNRTNVGENDESRFSQTEKREK